MRGLRVLSLLVATTATACHDAPSPPSSASGPAPASASASASASALAQDLPLPSSLPDEVTDPLKGWPPGHVPPRERERVAVDLGQGSEAYVLRWKSTPEPACFTADARSLARCKDFPGGAETGAVELVRVREGRDVDAIDLTEVLGEKGRVVLPRFTDVPRFSARGLAEAGTVKLLVLVDVNQDGRAAEAVLPGTWRAPTSTRVAALVGFAPKGGKGFAFVTARAESWERVRTTKDAFDVVTWPCFDHASPEEYVDRFEKTPTGVTRTHLVFACGGNGRAALKTEDAAEPLGL